MRSGLCRLLILAIVLLFMGNAPGWAAKSQKSEIRVGVYLPMTGAVAAFGQMEWAGIQVAQKMAPKALGRPIRLFLVDEKSDKIEAANAVSRLIKKERVQAILGTATSSNTLAGAPIVEDAKIPMISPTATNPLVTQNRKYVFRVCFIDPFQGEVAAKFAYNNLKARKAAVLIDIAQDYCVGLANFFVKSFVKLGGKIAATTYCQTGDQDFSAQLSSIISAKPDLLYLPNYYSEDALTARQAYELGLKVPILSADGAQAPELIKIGGSAVEGFSFTGHFAKEGATTKLAKDFIKKFEEEKGEEASAFHALGADAYFLLVDALNRAGTTDGAKVREVLASTKNWQAVSGTINIGKDGNAVKSVVIIQVKDGKFQYLTTINP